MAHDASDPRFASRDESIVRFGVFELNVRTRELRKRGFKVRLPDQAFQILQMLLERPGEVVTREELRQRLWSTDETIQSELQFWPDATMGAGSGAPGTATHVISFLWRR